MSKIPAFSERLQKITIRNRKRKHLPGEPWPIEKRVEVVSQWLVIGNMKQVAAISGVPYDLIRKWKALPWWDDLVAEIRSTQNIELDNKLSVIVNKSLDAVLDRVENGDFIYDQKSGEVRRRPAALRDIHRVAVDTMSKREVLRKDDPIETTKTTVEEHLKMLAHEMARWNKANENKPEVIDLVEVEDAVYEEGEREVRSGLQEGTSVGTHEEADEGSGQGGEEQGESD